VWLLIGAIAVAGVFAGLRWRTVDPPIVDARDEAPAAESRPVVDSVQSVAGTPSPEAAPASSPAEGEATSEVEAVSDAPEPAAIAPVAAPARAVKKAVRKPAIPHHAPAAAKPAPARPSTVRSASPSTPPPHVRPGWRDPFDQ
jgi:hypothetical protein